MRVLVVVLFSVGLVSSSTYYSNEDGGYFPGHWNHRQASEESSVSVEFSDAALADSGETGPNRLQEVKITKIELPPPPVLRRLVPLKVSTTTKKPLLTARALKTMKPKTVKPIRLKTTTAAPEMPASSSEETDF